MGLTVNGVVIPEEKIVEEMDRLRGSYETYVRENGGEPSEKELREWSEEDLIETELLRAEALATQPPPTDEAAQRNIDACSDFYEKIPEEERLPRSREALCVRALEKEIRKHVPQPTEDDMRKQYTENPSLFMGEEELRLSHVCRWIGVGGDNRANAFLELLRVKSEVVQGSLTWSDAVFSCSDTGEEDFGLFPEVRRGNLPQEIEDKLFGLAPGEISDAIELNGESVHLFKVMQKLPARQLAFKDVRETLATALFERAYQEALDAKFDALKQAAVIRRDS